MVTMHKELFDSYHMLFHITSELWLWLNDVFTNVRVCTTGNGGGAEPGGWHHPRHGDQDG